MKTITFTDSNKNEQTLKIAQIKNVLLEGKVPAMITSDNKFFIQIHADYPMMDYANFKNIKMQNPGKIPIGILGLEKYYEAAEQVVLTYDTLGEE